MLKGRKVTQALFDLNVALCYVDEHDGKERKKVIRSMRRDLRRIELWVTRMRQLARQT